MSNWASMSAFDARADLKKYGDNALLLYALELKYNIGDEKTHAEAKASNDTPTIDAEKATLAFFRFRGSIHLLMAAIGACMEMFLEETIAWATLIVSAVCARSCYQRLPASRA